uniref:Uncharacterized protein n=1 Tax=Sparus aurata TaxID=8175 RepID=A0A671U6L9_SPAAU
MSAEAARLVGRGTCVNGSDDKRDKKQPARDFAVLSYAGTEKEDDDIKGKGVYAAGGLGYVRAEDGLVCFEAKGPSVGLGAGASDELGARLFAKAELASVSASVGAMKATLGLSADTGIGVGPSGVEAKFLGTGVSIGRELGFSVFGSGVTVKLW